MTLKEIQAREKRLIALAGSGYISRIEVIERFLVEVERYEASIEDADERVEQVNGLVKRMCRDMLALK